MRRTALITGGSRGIGRGIALALAELGFDLLLSHAQNQAAAATTAEDCQDAARAAGHEIRVFTCRGDIASAVDRDNLIAFARARFASLDLLVNNAGIAPEIRADILDATESSFDRLMAVNVKGPFFLTQSAARWMIEAGPTPSPNRPAPKIVTVGSISAYTASVNRADYCVSKAALSMLTPLYAIRLAGHGIRVFEVRPGIIATDMTSSAKEKYDRLIADGMPPLARWGLPGDVGKAVAAIAQDLLPFSTGEVINVDGGFHLRQL